MEYDGNDPKYHKNRDEESSLAGKVSAKNKSEEGFFTWVEF